MRRTEIDEDEEIQKLLDEGLLTKDLQEVLIAGRCYDQGYIAWHNYSQQIEDLKDPNVQELMRKGKISAKDIIFRKIDYNGPKFAGRDPTVKDLLLKGYVDAEEVIWISEANFMAHARFMQELTAFSPDKLARSLEDDRKLLKLRESIALEQIECEIRVANQNLALKALQRLKKISKFL